MRPLAAFLVLAALPVFAQQTFTLEQTLAAPYALSLTAAPVGDRFAWVENAAGVRNIWIASAHESARAITHYTDDDGQDLANLAWSPDASAIAYTYGAEFGHSGKPANPAHLQRSTALQVILQPLEPNAPATVIGEGRAPFFTHDGASIFFLRSGQIFVACVKNCPAAASLSPPHQILYDRGSASALTLSPDGKALAYISHRGTHAFLALFDLATQTLTFPAPSTGNDSAPSFSRDGKQLAWLRNPFTEAPEFATHRTSANPWSIQLLDLTTHESRTVFTPQPNQPGSAEPRMSTGDPHLYWTADKHVLFFSEADGWVHLYALDPEKSSPPSLLTPGRYEVEDVSVSQDGQIVFFSANDPESIRDNACAKPPCTASRSSRDPLDSDRRHLWEIDLRWATPSPYAVTGGDGIETHAVYGATSRLAALVSDARAPLRPALIDVQGRSNLLHPNAQPKQNPGELILPQQVLFPSSDKLFELHGQLFLPKTPSPIKHPAILFFHGGPRRQMLLGYPAMDYYSNAYAMNQYLASRGYIVLSVNYRGGIGYGLNFRQCEHCGADGAAEYADVLGAHKYLASRPDVDAAHIGIWGGSYGGYLTALALARNSNLFAAGVDFHGVHEWSLEDNAPADWLRSPTSDPTEIARIAALAHASSPMADIAKWRSPILLIHGDDDPDVAYSQTPLLADALRARNVPVEELIFPDEVHTFLLHKDWLAAYTAAAAFFDRTLKPKP